MEVTTRVTKTITVPLTDEILLLGIRRKLNLADNEGIIDMKIKIPGGGDYSNMSVGADALTLVITTESFTRG